MVLLAYEGALRSHELLVLKKSDIDFVFQEITLRPKATRRQIGLTIPCPDYLLTMLIKYMDQERRLAEEDDLLFISESRSQAGQLLSYNEWATIVKRIAQRAGAPLFKTDTFRHLHLVQIAHAGVPLVNIVDFAGYRNARSAMLYFGLKMRDELTAMRLEFHC